ASCVACRILAFFAFVLAVWRHWVGPLPWQKSAAAVDPEFLRFSFWQIGSNLVGNVVVYADRALLVSLFPVSQVAFYNVPLEILSRLLIVVNGATTVAFPVISRQATDQARFDELYAPAITGIVACVAPLLLLLGIFAPQALHFWLGDQFQ